MLIRPLLFKTEKPAFDLAKLFFEQYPELNFEDDLLDYMRTGVVVSKPKLFVMAKIIDWEDPEKPGTFERMWFCRIAIGNLVDLVSQLLILPYFPRVAFCRNNRAEAMRICTIKRLCQLAHSKLKETTWAAAAA